MSPLTGDGVESSCFYASAQDVPHALQLALHGGFYLAIHCTYIYVAQIYTSLALHSRWSSATNTFVGLFRMPSI